MDLAAFPWASGSVLFVGLSMIVSTAGAVIKGLLVPRSHIVDIRKDRDDRVSEAERDADAWRQLFEAERSAHETTRRAYAEEIGAALAASTEGAQVAAALLTAIQQRQIEARP